jgi:hypothetical protein
VFSSIGDFASLYARVAEMVRFIDDYCISHFLDTIKAVKEIAASSQIRVVEDDEVAEIATLYASKMRKISLQITFPHISTGGLGNQQDHTFSLMFDQPLNEHEPDKSFAQAYTIADEGSAILATELYKSLIALFLILVQNGIHL